MSPVWDHWPVEVEVFVPRPWVLLRNSQPPVRWNKHALQVALDDRAVGNAFLRDCEQAALHVTHLIAADMNHKALEAHWMKLQLALHDVAKDPAKCVIRLCLQLVPFVADNGWSTLLLSAVVEPQCWGGLPLTPALVGDGRVALLKAAKAQARYRATPQGALPAELWQLVMQKRCVGPRSFNLVPDLCMKAFEQFPLRGYNPQCWCDGQGCPLPKPGGASGPDGQRIINLLDPGRSLAGQAESQQFSTATTLFDLTKAFDTLALQSIEEEVTNSNMPDSVRALLLDLHRRLRIGLTLVDGDKLMLKLESGVLQGGGTGPRLFRMSYDSCIACWQHETHEFAQPVEYLGCLHSVGVAAYADDLVRIVSGCSLEHLDSGTIACTESLATLLHRRGLKLNAKKGETLLSLEGAGAYDAARRAFSGTWKGYPPKQVVKYLGAHIQSNGSLQSEVRKRTASARLGFAKFARFFKRSTVPFSRKVLVFKAVVNGALLSGLEVRTLSPSDCQSLEKARGLLLRRLFWETWLRCSCW
eukprot:symbB.v1.2.008568.t1/scaffold511.1/size325556/15